MQTIRVLTFPCGAENALELHDALMVEGTSIASRHAGHYILCLLTYD